MFFFFFFFSVIVVGFLDFRFLVFVLTWFYLVAETFATRVHSSLSMSPD
jgi:hypothetical protein